MWTGVRSPWLGFAQFWWDGFRGSEEMNTLSEWSIRAVTPCSAYAFLRSQGRRGGPGLFSRPRALHRSVGALLRCGQHRCGVNSSFPERGRPRGIFNSAILFGEGFLRRTLGYFMRSMAGIHWNAGRGIGENSGPSPSGVIIPSVPEASEPG